MKYALLYVTFFEISHVICSRKYLLKELTSFLTLLQIVTSSSYRVGHLSYSVKGTGLSPQLVGAVVIATLCIIGAFILLLIFYR